MTTANNISDLASLLVKAQAEYVLAEQAERHASRNATEALNRLNDCQKALDTAVGAMREKSPTSSNWGRRSRSQASADAGGGHG
jgi:hypothetical protein